MPPRKPNWKKRKPADRRRTYIAEWRDFRGMTQEQLADELNTTKATISRIENRELPYSQDFLELCADVLGVHASTLLTRPPSDEDRIIAVIPPAAAARARGR